MDSQVTSLINDQINFELYSAYLYFEIENYYNDQNLNGFANWFHVQVQEELDHVYLLCQYLHNNGEKVCLQKINKPDLHINSHLSAVQSAYDHEKQVSERFNQIFEASFQKKDYRTTHFLDWFIKEQGEEEKTTKELVDKILLFGNDPKSLYLLNNELMSRVYTAPTLTL